MLIIPFWLILVISGLALLVGMIIDIKKREVPDILTYSLMSFGLIIGLLSSIYLLSWEPMLYSFSGLVFAYIIGALLFYSGQWGGGDAKMLMGLGALWGLPVLSFFSESVSLFSLPALVLFTCCVFIAGVVYGLIVIMIKIFMSFSSFKKSFYALSHEEPFKSIRWFVLVVVCGSLLFGIFSGELYLRLLVLSLGICVLLTYYLFLIAKVVEKTIFIDTMNVDDLTEGEWVAKEVSVSSGNESPVFRIKEFWSSQYRGKEFHHDKTKSAFVNNQTKKSIKLIVYDVFSGKIFFWSFFRRVYLFLSPKTYLRVRKKIILALHLRSEKSFEDYCLKNSLSFLPQVLKKQAIFFDKKILASPNPEGLSLQQIKLLKKHNISSVLIKKGVPFMPAFFLGFLVFLVLFIL